jgi:hypothetical protein
VAIAPSAQLKTASVARRRSWLRRWTGGRAFLVALIAIVTLFIIPASYRFVVRHFLFYEANRVRMDLEIGEMRGNLFTPLSLRGTKISWTTPFRTTARFAISQIEADFSLWKFFWPHATGCVKKLTLIGLDASIGFEPAQNSGGTADGIFTEVRSRLLRFFPQEIDARHMNFTFRDGAELLRLSNLRLNLNSLGPGSIALDSMVFEHDDTWKRFVTIRGTVARRDDRVTFADLTLQPGIRLDRIQLDLDALANGSLKMDFAIAAFDGFIRGELRNAPRVVPLRVQATGSFDQIAIDKFAQFVERNDSASGTLSEGKFTFDGSPRSPLDANISTRFIANDFRWGNRRWSALRLGATLSNRRIHLIEFQLEQAHNELRLTGEVSLPARATEWWQSDFSVEIRANLKNVTELSTLFGDGFAETAGSVTIDGSVRAENRSFKGHLDVTGSHLSWRTAPLEAMHAAIQLNGNELKVTNLEFLHGEDFLRGTGVVNIFGEKRYWGELHASVENLALYSAFFEPPIAPRALGGTLIVDWSGDGTAKAHSGAINVHGKKIHVLNLANTHPIDADIVATYAPENIFFSKFVLADRDTFFSAIVTASPTSLNLQNMHLEYQQTEWLEGNVLLPVNIWNLWREASWEHALDWEGALQIDARAHALQFRETALLSGTELPWKGKLDANLAGSGVLAHPAVEGKIEFTRGDLSIARNVTLKELTVSFDGAKCTVEKSAVEFAGIGWTANGTIDFSTLADPVLSLRLASTGIAIHPTETLSITLAADLVLDGRWSDASLAGKFDPIAAAPTGNFDLVELLEPMAVRTSVGIFPGTEQWPFANWKLNWTCANETPIGVTNVRTDLLVTGTGRAPNVTGRLDFSGLKAASPFAQFTIGEGTLQAAGRETTISMRGQGVAAGEPFTAWIYGSRAGRNVWIFSEGKTSTESLMNRVKFGSDIPPIPLELDQKFNLESFVNSGDFPN